MEFKFPPPDTADDTGLVAVTDSMTPELVLQAYREGIFPWSDNPVRWYSPDPRAIFVAEHVRLPKNLGRLARKQKFVVTFDQAFADVMRGCAKEHFHEGAWISRGFIKTYSALHAMGFGHSVEVWQNEALVGGLYGVQIGGFFSGESMFYTVSNAYKVAFAALIDKLATIGATLLDAQAINAHTARLGAVLVRRETYLKVLKKAIKLDCPWS